MSDESHRDDIEVRIITNENGELDRLRGELRERIVGQEGVTESEDTSELSLTQAEFIAKILQEPNGQALLDLMESGEWRVCERMGLCNGRITKGVAYIDVPAWKNLVAHLQIVNSV
jgi:hypothetical protein